MTSETHSEYFKRAITDLGQAAHDSERMAIWCYDHPPMKPLPKADGARERHIYISRRTVKCLASVAGGPVGGSPDGLAESILLQWIQAHIPEVKAMYERHEQEITERLAELRKHEPELTTTEFTREEL